LTKRSSTNEPPEITFFTDRDLGPTVATELTDGGLQVEPYARHFALDNVPDTTWLRFVGDRGWVALTHNKYIRWERAELDELMLAGVRAFFIIGKGPHCEFARAVIDCYDDIRAFLRENPGPFAARLYQQTREVKMWLTLEEWKAQREKSRRR
jgi:hypothetical protein